MSDTKEFKVDKRGFYRTRCGKIALVSQFTQIGSPPGYPGGYPYGYAEDDGQYFWASNGRLYDYEESKYDLIEFIAPFDVWKVAELLVLAKEQKDTPPEFDKLFKENFWNLLA